MSTGTTPRPRAIDGVCIGFERAGRFAGQFTPISTASLSICCNVDLRWRSLVSFALVNLETSVTYPLGVLYVLNINWGPIHRRRCGPLDVTISTCDSQRSSLSDASASVEFSLISMRLLNSQLSNGSGARISMELSLRRRFHCAFASTCRSMGESSFCLLVGMSIEWKWKQSENVKCRLKAGYSLELYLGSRSYWIIEPWPAITNIESQALRGFLSAGISRAVVSGWSSQSLGRANVAQTRRILPESSDTDDCRWRDVVALGADDAFGGNIVNGWRSCFMGETCNGFGNGGNLGLWYGSELTLPFSVCRTGLLERPSADKPAERW